jgi:hypothetical protein
MFLSTNRTSVEQNIGIVFYAQTIERSEFYGTENVQRVAQKFSLWYLNLVLLATVVYLRQHW